MMEGRMGENEMGETYKNVIIYSGNQVIEFETDKKSKIRMDGGIPALYR